jgi:GTPase
VLFVIDASEPLGEQDQRLAALLRDAGRGVVLVCNKWDLVDEDRRRDLERNSTGCCRSPRGRRGSTSRR